ncbi:MAG TPA: hypothetical protein VLX61_06700 [Anaerolineales bacterium]|nr:hypothetical protein [Anaerolineales bacterium]
MLLLDAPPDTSAYMIAGYIVFFVVAAIYLLSLLVRWRNLHEDMTTLESIEKESKVIPQKTVRTAKRKGANKKTAKKK